RQNGTVMGLEFDHPKGAMHVMKALYKNGIWAIFSTLEPRVLQFKPGVLKTHELCAEILDRVEASIGEARAEVKGLGARRPACATGRWRRRKCTTTGRTTSVRHRWMRAPQRCWS